jgi:hypothetical protein
MTLLDRLTGTQTTPSDLLVAGTALAALALVLPPRVWRVTRGAVTIAHEGGHALVALLTRRRLSGIRLHSDTSGLTVSRGKPTGPGMVLTAAAGYAVPPLLGLGGAALVADGRVTLLLWVATALLAAMLVMLRNAYGVLSVLVVGGAFLLVSWLGGPDVRSGFACVAVWFLLVGGVRPALELMGRHRASAPGSDPAQLARLTHTPPALWTAFFVLLGLLCLVGGARLLL